MVKMVPELKVQLKAVDSTSSTIKQKGMPPTQRIGSWPMGWSATH